ncbi:MAG: hypothetical protein LBT80_01655 [Lactobacillaceae bacterium]|jgi:hypothetical protein|nr:hypothetical protein [Lactobacillaceae bacterium]
MANNYMQIIMQEWQRADMVVNAFTNADIQNGYNDLVHNMQTEKDAANTFVLAIRATKNKGGKGAKSVQNQIDMWLFQGLTTAEEVQAYEKKAKQTTSPKTFKQLDRETVLEESLQGVMTDDELANAANALAVQVASSNRFAGLKYSWDNDVLMQDRIVELTDQSEYRGNDYNLVINKAFAFTRELLHWTDSFDEYLNGMFYWLDAHNKELDAKKVVNIKRR